MVIISRFMRVGALLPHIQIGDLLEIKRYGYRHWAVAVEKYYDFIQHTDVVICCHFTVQSSSAAGAALQLCFDIFTTGHIEIQNLRTIAGNWEVRINNLLDMNYAPKQPNIIALRATGEMGPRPYHVLHANCDGYAHWARYGLRQSEQAMDFVRTRRYAFFVILWLMFFMMLIYFVFKYVNRSR